MAWYRCPKALPHSLPGSIEQHYGYQCEIRSDGVWINLDEISAANFLNGQIIIGPVIPDIQVPVAEEVPVVGESSEKPKRQYKPRQSKQSDILGTDETQVEINFS